jgi:hypothetical protein
VVAALEAKFEARVAEQMAGGGGAATTQAAATQ